MAQIDDIEAFVRSVEESSEPSGPNVPRITVSPGAAQPTTGADPEQGVTPSGAGTQRPEEQAAEIEAFIGSISGEQAPGLPESPAGAVPGPTHGTPTQEAPNAPTGVPALDVELPPEEGATPEISAVHNFMRAMNKRLAGTLAMPSDAFNALLTNIGLGIVEPGKMREINKEAFEAAGIRTDPFNGLSSQLGDAAYDGLMQSLAFMVAAPALAAKQGVTATSLVIRHLAEQIQKYPAMFTVSNMTGEAGAKFAEEQTRGMGGSLKGDVGQALAPIAGSVAGGVAGSLALNTARRTAEIATSGAKAVARATGLTKPPAAAEPLVPKGFELGHSTLKQYMEHQLDNSMDYLYSAIANAIERVPKRGTTAELAKKVDAGLETAKKIGLRIQSEYWERADVRRRMPMNHIVRAARKAAAVWVDEPSARPDKFIQAIIALGSPLRGPDGKLVKSLPTIKRVRDLMGEIDNARRSELRGGPGHEPRERLAGNMARLESILDEGIGLAFPDDVPLRQAREYSHKFNDLFRRGGIADVMRRRISGEDVVPDEEVVKELMGKHKGLFELLEVRDKLVYTRQPGANRFAVTGEERKGLQQLIVDTEDTIRAMYREEAERVGKRFDDPVKAAKAAEAWFAKQEPHIKSLARVTAEIEGSAKDALSEAMRVQRLQKSALARFMQTDDPQKAVSLMYGRKDFFSGHENIMDHIGHDKDAVKAYGQGLIVEFWNRTGADPIRMYEALQEPLRRRMFHQALGPEAYGRFASYVDGARRIAIGESGVGGKISKTARGGSLLAASGGLAMMEPTTGVTLGTSIIMGKIIGAGIGSHVAKATGHGNIQTPAFISGAFGRSIERAFKNVPPGVMFSLVVQDPAWETRLFKRIPKNMDDLHRAERNMRLLVTGIIGARKSAERGIFGDEREAP